MKDARPQEKSAPPKEEDDILNEKTITVKNKEIPESVQAMVADICLSIADIRSPAEHRKLAKKIKEALDKKYEKGWNVIIGESFTGSCSIAKNNFLEMRMANVDILVFKSSAPVKKQ
ncbi:dynein light chain LC8-type [Nematocida major]|uniref:dynein light chain LC8-type n=1 Tax=Nematocida major TaxID=1912982 RepID=UPI0020081B55|nr:dynein light chain LC8-type [Nematocida major]KAH9385919.1 dynein light chain LC8-type [Nematocida major]